MISATLDSSALIRGLHTGSRAALLIIGNARAGNIRMDLSEPILKETLRVLRDRFEWNGDMIHHARETLTRMSNFVAPTETLSVIKEDPSDDRILECAAAANSDYIVSEDKDLLRLGQCKGSRIVTVADFVKAELSHGAQR